MLCIIVAYFYTPPSDFWLWDAILGLIQLFFNLFPFLVLWAFTRAMLPAPTTKRRGDKKDDEDEDGDGGGMRPRF